MYVNVLFITGRKGEWAMKRAKKKRICRAEFIVVRRGRMGVTRGWMS